MHVSEAALVARRLLVTVYNRPQVWTGAAQPRRDLSGAQVTSGIDWRPVPIDPCMSERIERLQGTGVEFFAIPTKVSREGIPNLRKRNTVSLSQNTGSAPYDPETYVQSHSPRLTANYVGHGPINEDLHLSISHRHQAAGGQFHPRWIRCHGSCTAVRCETNSQDESLVCIVAEALAGTIAPDICIGGMTLPL